MMQRIPCPSTACRNGMERIDEGHSILCETCGGDNTIMVSSERAEKYSAAIDRLTVAIIKQDLSRMRSPLHVQRQRQDLQTRSYLAERLRDKRANNH